MVVTIEGQQIRLYLNVYSKTWERKIKFKTSFSFNWTYYYVRHIVA